MQADEVFSSVGPNALVLARFSGLNRVRLEALDPRTGARRWQSPVVSAIGLPSTDGVTLVTFSDAHADAYSAATGRHLWSSPGSYQAVTVDNTAYLVTPKTPKNQPPQGGG